MSLLECDENKVRDPTYMQIPHPRYKNLKSHPEGFRQNSVTSEWQILRSNSSYAAASPAGSNKAPSNMPGSLVCIHTLPQNSTKAHLLQTHFKLSPFQQSGHHTSDGFCIRQKRHIPQSHIQHHVDVSPDTSEQS